MYSRWEVPCAFCNTPNAAGERFCKACRKLILPERPGQPGTVEQLHAWNAQPWPTADPAAQSAVYPPSAIAPHWPAPPGQQPGGAEPRPWPPPAPGILPFPGQAQARQYAGQPYYGAPGYAPHPGMEPSYPDGNQPLQTNQWQTPPYAMMPNATPPGYVPGTYAPAYQGSVPAHGPQPAYDWPHPTPPGYPVVVEEPGSLAEFWPRFGALMVDWCVLAVIWFTVIGVAAFVNSALLGVLATFLIPPLYFIGFWASSGRTPGYRAAGLQLIKSDGTKPGMGQSIVRYLATLLSWSSCCLGYLWMLWDRDHQTWHDKIANTNVINMR